MATYKTYTVKKGDNLTDIAKEHGTTVEAIKKANSSLIKNVNSIQIGWKLKIPVTKDYDAIGKQFEKALDDISNLASVKKLKTMLGG